jgi:hypothetical protein
MTFLSSKLYKLFIVLVPVLVVDVVVGDLKLSKRIRWLSSVTVLVGHQERKL